MTQASTVPAPVGTDVARRSHFRPDVEGLRAIAILAVVGYHCGLPFLRGGFVGVDVFFVISGFLITGLLVSEAARTGRLSLGRFWARRARRLLPAATLVIAVTAVASWFVVPVVDHRTTGFDLTASALYVANIRFAMQATDYLSQDAAPSPALHFWSLGVEEQFYAVWPLLVLLVLWLVHRRWVGRDGVRAHLPTLLAGALGLLGLVSFVVSLRLTDRVQPWAFFGTQARAWEFALGGLLAIGGPFVARLPRAVLGLLGLGGLGVLLASMVLIDGESTFPGTVALWPVLATVAVIASGARRSGAVELRGVPGLLATRPLRLVGRLSYSWYLWHWPALVLVGLAVGGLGVRVSLVVALLSLVPAAIAYRWIEQPVRHSAALAASPRRSLRLGAVLSGSAAAVGLVLALLPGGGAFASGDGVAQAEESVRPVTQATPGATAAPKPSVSPSAPAVAWPTGALTPSPTSARDDIPAIYGNGCHLSTSATSSPSCVFGDATSATTVVLIGDSHAAQWFPALEAAATSHHWRFVSWTKSGCPAPDVTIVQRKGNRDYDECDTWRNDVLARLTSGPRPALVVLAGTRTESLASRTDDARLAGTPQAGPEWKAGWKRTITRLTAAGIHVAVLRDTPWPGKDMARCVGQHESDPSACDLPLSSLDDPAYDVGVAHGLAGASGVDLDGLLCTATSCPATLGKYLVYRDSSHLTATMAAALAPYLAAALAPLLLARE